MNTNREDRRTLLLTMAKLPDGLGKLNSVYLNALKAGLGEWKCPGAIS